MTNIELSRNFKVTDCLKSGEALALADVMAHIENRRILDATPAVFKLTELSKLYCASLVRYKVPASSKTHSSRLRERLLANCPELTSVPHGRDVFLTFEQDIGMALQQATENTDSDAVSLMHAAKLLRHHLFSSGYNFNGNLTGREATVPPALLNFVTMLLEGPGDVSHLSSEAALSVSQLLMFNAVKRRRQPVVDKPVQPVTVRHCSSSETPLPIYIGLLLHSASRKKEYIHKCHSLACVSRMTVYCR